jgi:hypothetical protein
VRERTVLALTVVAVWIAAFVGAAPSVSDRAFLAWAAERYDLTAASRACLAAELDHGLLEGLPEGRPSAQELGEHGLEVVPLDQRQAVGDAVLACALAPEGA